MLTFDHLAKDDDEVNAVELEVPGVSAQALRDGLLADPAARERLFGGSVTRDRHLLLVADLADAQLARTFAQSIGGDLSRAVTRYGEREFVDGPLPVRVERRTLVVEGGPQSDRLALALRAGRLEVDFGDDGSAEFAVARDRFDRIRVEAGDGVDALAFRGSSLAERFDVEAAGQRVRLTRDVGDLRIELDDVEQLRVDALDGADAITVGDVSATDVFQVDSDLGDGDGDLDRAAATTPTS